MDECKFCHRPINSKVFTRKDSQGNIIGIYCDIFCFLRDNATKILTTGLGCLGFGLISWILFSITKDLQGYTDIFMFILGGLAWITGNILTFIAILLFIFKKKPLETDKTVI